MITHYFYYDTRDMKRKETLASCGKWIKDEEIDLQNLTCKECKEAKDKYEDLKID